MRIIIYLLSAGVVFASSMSVGAEPWLYLGEGNEALMPKLKAAAALIAKQPECVKLTEGTWGEAGKDVNIPGRKGLMFRATCEVKDLPGWPYDNFWIAPDVIKRSSIYRQRTGTFLSGGKK